MLFLFTKTHLFCSQSPFSRDDAREIFNLHKYIYKYRIWEHQLWEHQLWRDLIK